MAAIITRRKRRQQPEHSVEGDWSCELLKGAKQLYNGRDTPLIKQRNYANPSVLVGGSGIPLRAGQTRAGIGWQPASDSYTLELVPSAEVNARNPWTYACVASFSDVTKSALAIIAEGPGASTRDRSLYIDQSATKHFAANIFDGVGETALGATVVPVNGQPYILVVTCTSSLLSLYVDGALEATKAVSNAGYNGFSTNCSLNLGFGSNAGLADSSSATIPLFLRCDNFAWGRGEVDAFTDNPYQVWRPRIRRLYSVGQAAAPSFVAHPQVFVRQAANRASTY